MKARPYLAILFFSSLFLSGCRKADHVATIKSPLDGVFYTVEVFHGIGLSPDVTRVYAHFERDGRSSRKFLVIDGEDLEFSKIAWDDPHNVTFCMKSGSTDSFRSEATLSIGLTSVTIYNHLQEDSRPCAECR